MILYLIRHGETDLNKQKRLQGHTDIELNAYGRELAHITAKALEDVDFDVSFTSPLKRAKETAEIILGDRKVQLIEESRIMEIGFGIYEGLCYKGENRDIPDPEWINFFDNPGEYKAPLNGESFDDIIKRTGDFFTDIVSNEEYFNKTILVSTHGCALKAILVNACNIPVDGFWGRSLNKNCGVTILSIEGSRVDVIEDGKVYY